MDTAVTVSRKVHPHRLGAVFNPTAGRTCHDWAYKIPDVRVVGRGKAEEHQDERTGYGGQTSCKGTAGVSISDRRQEISLHLCSYSEFAFACSTGRSVVYLTKINLTDPLSAVVAKLSGNDRRMYAPALLVQR